VPLENTSRMMGSFWKLSAPRPERERETERERQRKRDTNILIRKTNVI
jgi:hypothetical protein